MLVTSLESWLQKSHTPLFLLNSDVVANVAVIGFAVCRLILSLEAMQSSQTPFPLKDVI